jgi:hypothetical protein
MMMMMMDVKKQKQGEKARKEEIIERTRGDLLVFFSDVHPSSRGGS